MALFWIVLKTERPAGSYAAGRHRGPEVFLLLVAPGLAARESPAKLRHTPNPTPMESTPPPPPISKKLLWTSYVLSALPVLLFLFSGGMKLIRPPQLAEGFTHLGWPVSTALGLGILELSCTIIYVIPRTAVIGAILLTGYLGGAMATHVRIGEPVITHIVLGVLVWAGLYLRDRRLHDLMPFRR